MWLIWQGTEDFPNNFWRELGLLGWFDIFFFRETTFNLQGICVVVVVAFVAVRCNTALLPLTFFFFITSAYIVHFLTKLVCGGECCIRICSGCISCQAGFFFLFCFALRYIFQWERRTLKHTHTRAHKVGLQIQSVSLLYLLLQHHMFPHCSQGGTLFAARILCIIPLLYILENTNQNKVGEDDHALTQKATEPSLRLSSFLFFFSLSEIFWG